MTEPGQADAHEVVSGRADRLGPLSTLGSVVLAAVSSACCWLPLLLIGFGLSAAGVSAFIERWRAYVAGGAIALLGLGFYTAYIRSPTCSSGACGAGSRRMLRLRRGAVWVAAVFVTAFVLFPRYVGALTDAAGWGAAPAGAATATAGDPVLFDVEGMTCQGCAAALEAEIARSTDAVEIDVDFESGTARVRGDGAELAPQVGEAARRLGFTATPRSP